MMNKKAQAIIEYALFISLAIATIAAMQVYFKRAVQGHLRRGIDNISGGALYSPGGTTSISNITKETTENSSSYIVDNDPNNRDDKTIHTDAEITRSQQTTGTEELSPFSEDKSNEVSGK